MRTWSNSFASKKVNVLAIDGANIAKTCVNKHRPSTICQRLRNISLKAFAQPTRQLETFSIPNSKQMPRHRNQHQLGGQKLVPRDLPSLLGACGEMVGCEPTSRNRNWVNTCRARYEIPSQVWQRWLTHATLSWLFQISMWYTREYLSVSLRFSSPVFASHSRIFYVKFMTFISGLIITYFISRQNRFMADLAWCEISPENFSRLFPHAEFPTVYRMLHACHIDRPWYKLTPLKGQPLTSSQGV